MAAGWRRWFVLEGRLRTLWRVLLFGVGFLALLQVGLILLAAVGEFPVAQDRLSGGLVVRATLALLAALCWGWVLLVGIDGRPPADLGFGLSPRVPTELLAGLAVGIAAILGTTALVSALGGYRYVAEAGTAAGWLAVAGSSLVAFALPAAAEEAVFRGYLFRTLIDGAGPFWATVLTSLVFALAHGGNPNVAGLGLLNIFLAGVLLAVAVLRTGSLWFASTLHLGWNWVMAGPLDLPVSGLESFDIPLYDVVAGSPAWLSGGAFGPEGGLAGTIAVTIGLTLVIRMTRPGSRLAGPPAHRRTGHGD